MTRRRFQDVRAAGLQHVVLGLGLIIGTGLYAHAPERMLEAAGYGEMKMPQTIVTHGAMIAACEAETVDTLIGSIGCGATRRAAHLDKITLRRGG